MSNKTFWAIIVTTVFHFGGMIVYAAWLDGPMKCGLPFFAPINNPTAETQPEYCFSYKGGVGFWEGVVFYDELRKVIG